MASAADTTWAAAALPIVGGLCLVIVLAVVLIALLAGIGADATGLEARRRAAAEDDHPRGEVPPVRPVAQPPRAVARRWRRSKVRAPQVRFDAVFDAIVIDQFSDLEALAHEFYEGSNYEEAS